MTIKEFSRLCGCNPQTLRYYDHVDLLKPVKVDSWTGYRYYDEDQALQFVKIKNLQKTYEVLLAALTLDDREQFITDNQEELHREIIPGFQCRY